MAFGELYARLGLALQCAAGHRVTAWGAQPDTAGHGVWAWFEFEHDEVGAALLFFARGGPGMRI